MLVWCFVRTEGKEGGEKRQERSGERDTSRKRHTKTEGIVRKGYDSAPENPLTTELTLVPSKGILWYEDASFLGKNYPLSSSLGTISNVSLILAWPNYMVRGLLP